MRRSRCPFAAVLAGVLCVGSLPDSPAHGENFVVNGSFEIRKAGEPNKHCLDIDAPGGVEQTLPTTPGREYCLQFDMAGNVETEPSKKVLRVTLDGKSCDLPFDAAGHTREDLGWVRKEILFTARGGKTTLSFSNASPHHTASGVALDNVVVAEIKPGLPVEREGPIAQLQRLGAKVSVKDGTLRQVDLTDSPATDADMAVFDALDSLEHLTLNGCRQLTDAGLAHVKGLKNLKGLGLERTLITDAGLVHLSGLTRLTYLSLNWTQVGDSGLKHLAGLTDLGVLYLCETNTADAGLGALQGMKELQWLDLRGTRVTDAGLAHLGRLPRLRLLSLHGVHLTDAGLPLLTGLPNLEVLTLSQTAVTDAGLGALKRSPKLIELDLTDTRVTQTGVDALTRALPNCRVRFQVVPRPSRRVVE